MTKVKVCGITCAADALAAAAAGADAVGVVCHAAAPRCVGTEAASAIAAKLPAHVVPVLLFVDAPADAVAAASQSVPAAWLQFHGAEDPAYCASFARPYLKACTVRGAGDVERTMSDHARARAVIADGGAGTGSGFDWQLLPEPAQRTLPLVLAGGLDAGNVAAAIAAAAPEFVDVSSGVCRTGDKLRKDPAKLAAFISQVRLADAR